ncbi:hypothetical protein V8E54_004258 [Elaphomyces granulatus]
MVGILPSGGWAVTPLLNTTTIAATDDCSESFSFPKSGSIGRFCGGLFASAIIDKLVGESSPLVGPTTEQDTLGSSMQQEEPKKTETYMRFTDSVRRILVEKVGLLGTEMNATFSAQDNNWEAPWMGRSKPPLTEFKDRWDLLETRLPPTPTRSEDDGELESAATNIGARYSSLGVRTQRYRVEILHDMIRKHLTECKVTWRGGRGPGDCGRLNRFLRKKNPSDDEMLNMYLWLDYRFSLMKLANEYLDVTGTPRPLQLECADFDLESWLGEHYKKHGDLSCEYEVRKLLEITSEFRETAVCVIRDSLSMQPVVRNSWLTKTSRRVACLTQVVTVRDQAAGDREQFRRPTKE